MARVKYYKGQRPWKEFNAEPKHNDFDLLQTIKSIPNHIPCGEFFEFLKGMLAFIKRLGFMKFHCDSIYVLGGHALSLEYMERLLRAQKEDLIDFKKLYYIDDNAECIASKKIGEQAQLIPKTYDDFLLDLIESKEAETNSFVIPDHTAPHVLFRLFLNLLEKKNKNIQSKVVPYNTDLKLPFQKLLDSGICALSFATWICPIDCDEPDHCPGIDNTRTWDFRKTFQDYPLNLDHSNSPPHPTLSPKGEDEQVAKSTHLFYCDQLAYGVVGISSQKLCLEWNSFDQKVKALKKTPLSLEVATFTKCHGIIGRAEVRKS